MFLTQATLTITVPWWAYAALAATVLSILTAGYVAGRLDRREARTTAEAERQFAPVLDRWRHINQTPGRHAATGERGRAGVEGASAWPTNQERREKPTWAGPLQTWGQPRPPSGYLRPPVLGPESELRATRPAVAPVDGVRPDDQDTEWIPVVRP